MNLKTFYQVVYGPGEKPFQKDRGLADFISASMVAGLSFEEVNNSNEISSLDLYCYILDKLNMDLCDLNYCLEETEKGKDVDCILFQHFSAESVFDFCRDKLLELPDFALDKLKIDPKTIGKEKIKGIRQIVQLLDWETYTLVLKPEYNLNAVNHYFTERGEKIRKIINGLMGNELSGNELKSFIKKVIDHWGIDIKQIRAVRNKMIAEYDKHIFERAKNYYANKGKAGAEEQEELTKEGQSEGLFPENIEKISEMVIGQEKALERVKGRLMSSCIGFRTKGQPIASFLLTGPTGVGKTETAKAVADACFGGKIHVVDMSTFKNKIDVSRLLGGSPNYVGYGDKNAFCEFLTENPNSVILFDEIEKAHPECMDLLMRILDEGQFINAKGEVISLEGTVIFCTTNLTEYKKSTAGFGRRADVAEQVTEGIGLRKEQAGRFSEIIMYEKLSRESCIKIIQEKFLRKVIENFEKSNRSGLILKCSTDLIDEIIKEANTNLFGARDLKRAIQKLFINPVTEYIVKHKPSNTTLYVGKNGVRVGGRKKSSITQSIESIEK